MPVIEQVFPVKKQVQLEGLYLEQRLRDMAQQAGRSIVLTDFVTDKNGVIAIQSKEGQFQVPDAIKNASDWRLFHELMVQADIIISGGDYFRRLAKDGAQDILYTLEAGNKFEELGQWRLRAGDQKRSPDVAIVTRDLDFEIPQQLRESNRRIVIFTTDALAASNKAQVQNSQNTIVLGSGAVSVDGDRMIATLANEMGYRVIMMVSGPHVLDLLLQANRLDLLYVTQAQIEIPFDDPTTVKTILLGGKDISELTNFHLAHQFIQQDVVTEEGSPISQFFLKYERKWLWQPI